MSATWSKLGVLAAASPVWTYWLLLGALGVCACLTWQCGAVLRLSNNELGVRRFAAVSMLGLELAFRFMRWGSSGGDLEQLFAVQLSGVLVAASIWSLWTSDHWSFAVCFYWGAPLAVQTFLTPVTTAQWPDFRFVQYFLMHGCIVLVPIYLIAAGLNRPTFRSLCIMTVATDLIMLLVMAMNDVLGTNFLYTVERPHGRTLLNYFGPWPWYPIWAALTLNCFWILQTTPWLRRRRDAAALKNSNFASGGP
jgi:hypothetical integral membrane protein (TIGR02206 family)